ncbi:uncharacterized protein LOC132180450 [Corylus avellana]|uniref:uncharacterized protein LOC132180450 n=1 Tax=Corylus avellana TaxID=13451 RepID=UPI001E20A378|nr:uncharacterized protein LOC132180450 [Corylus avellana]
MGKLGCNIDGNLDDTKFSQPMPWIGIYVAAASLVCLVAMAADAILGIRNRKFWFPCKFSSGNATSLTLLAVAIKLSVDLNTSMPRPQDQLAKLSSTVFICTVMGNSMPSLGTMENKEMFMNIMALGILVITVIVNICIQLTTGVIYVFWKEHAFIMFIMLLLLLIISFSSLTVPTTKQFLEHKYNKKYELALKEGSNETGKPVVDKLKEDVMKYWVMSHSSSPQFVMARSVTCTASGAFCLMSAATLAEAMLRSFFMPRSFKFCNGESEYKWSTTLVLVIQTLAVGVGTIAPACRWFFAINYGGQKRENQSSRKELKVEHYWVQSLVEMKECPLTLGIRNRHYRKLAHDAKKQFLNLCIRVQSGIVIMSKLICLISIFSVYPILLCHNYCTELKKKFKFMNGVSNTASASESEPCSKLDLSRFVLRLEGEDELVGMMMKCSHNPTDHWIREGDKKRPKYLIELLETSTRGFKGVGEFDNNQVPSLDSEEPPNCWALPVVTLASIAVALPNISPRFIRGLICSVNEGLMYVRLIENNLQNKGDLTNIRKAADVVWLGVELYHKWLDVDLHKLSLQGKSLKETLQKLADNAKNRLVEFHKEQNTQCLERSPSKWPIKVLAANSMYRIAQTMLLNSESRYDQMSEKLSEAIAVMISDILGACLTNIHRVVSMKCLSSAIEEREESVRYAVCILGKTEKILKLLEKKALPSLDPCQMICIDEWRTLYMQKKPLPFPSEGKIASSRSGDLCLTIK